MFKLNSPESLSSSKLISLRNSIFDKACMAGASCRPLAAVARHERSKSKITSQDAAEIGPSRAADRPRSSPSRKTTSSRCRSRTRRGRRSSAFEEAQGSLAAGRAAIVAAPQARAVAAGRLPHDRCARRRALCRQGEEHQEARRRLCAADRARHPHRAHDRGDPHARIRRHPHRDRGAAARGEPDQAAAAALQCARCATTSRFLIS